MSANSTVDNTRSWPTPTSGSARNRSICASTGAVSPKKGSVSEPGSSTNRADGIWLAAARLLRCHAVWLSRRCTTNVGTRILDSNGPTSIRAPTRSTHGRLQGSQQPTSAAPPISQYWIMCNTGIGCFQTLDPEERPSRRIRRSSDRSRFSGNYVRRLVTISERTRSGYVAASITPPTSNTRIRPGGSGKATYCFQSALPARSRKSPRPT